MRGRACFLLWLGLLVSPVTGGLTRVYSAEPSPKNPQEALPKSPPKSPPKSSADTHHHFSTEHQEHHDHPANKPENSTQNSQIGPGKAVLDARPDLGLKLSDQAVQRLELRFVSIQTGLRHRVPGSSIVHHEMDHGIYRLRDGWLKLIDPQRVEPIAGSSEVWVETRELRPGDRIVSEGVPLLRVAELNAWSGQGASDGHD